LWAKLMAYKPANQTTKKGEEYNEIKTVGKKNLKQRWGRRPKKRGRPPTETNLLRLDKVPS